MFLPPTFSFLEGNRVQSCRKNKILPLGRVKVKHYFLVDKVEDIFAQIKCIQNAYHLYETTHQGCWKQVMIVLTSPHLDLKSSSSCLPAGILSTHSPWWRSEENTQSLSGCSDIKLDDQIHRQLGTVISEQGRASFASLNQSKPALSKN